MVTTYGVTSTGFTKKNFETIKSDVSNSLRSTLGKGFNLRDDEVIGQVMTTMCYEIASIHAIVEDLYWSRSRATASGVSLDNNTDLIGIERKEATKGTGEITFYGTTGASIPSGTIVSADGDADKKVETVGAYVIGTGTNEQQKLAFSDVPDAGDFTLIFEEEETSTLTYADTNATIQTAINAITSLGDVVVTGNFTDGFVFEFAGSSGEIDQEMLRIGENTLTTLGIQVLTEITEEVKGVLPNVVVPVQVIDAGFIQIFSETLTVIENPLVGVESCSNLLDITPGQDIETDPALRVRADKSVATAGAATVESIRASLLEIDEVSDCMVFENDEMVDDADGRPPKSFEAVVLGGDDQEIADEIWFVKGAGIETFGTESMEIIDSMGIPHTMNFSRPIQIPIYVSIENLVVDDEAFPEEGEEAIKEAIVTFALREWTIGKDVIYNRLHCPIADIEGVVDYDLYIGVAASPTDQDNIAIANNEVSLFDTSTIEVSA